MIQRLKNIFTAKSGPHKYLSVKIIDESSGSLPMDLSKAIRKLLRHLPNEHLIGLGSVTFMDDFDHKNDENLADAAGLYYRSYNMNPAYIELSISGIYGDAPYKMCLVPFVRKFWLAETLFHEIGHHYRHLTHGISKKENENFADQYQKKFIKRVVYPWRYVLKPLVWAYKFTKKRGLIKDSEDSE
jgi:hypothetical protein